MWIQLSSAERSITPTSARWWAASRAASDRYTVIAAAITSQMGKAKLPTHIELQAMRYGLPKESVILLEQVRTLDKQRLRQRMGQVDSDVMERVDAAIAVSFGLPQSRLV